MFELLVIFGGIIGIIGVSGYIRLVRDGKLGPAATGHQNQLVETLKAERDQLEARVQNLESIVCSVDLELNQRLNRLAAQQSAIGLLPAYSGAGTGAAGAATPTGATETAPTMASPQPGRWHGLGPLQAGQVIAGRYTIQRLIGQGGMGAVYLANDQKLGERVALKIVSAAIATDPEAAAERFRREVAAARKVTHANVLRIHDLIEEGDQLLLSMEYVDGVTLAAHLQRNGALRLDEGRTLIGQICDGLAAAHAAGVIHRDLKPGNILIDPAGRARLIDFGLAKASFLADMTATGLILGTPEYMAPEQVRGLPCDARSDLYSLGAVAYHVFCGQPPFRGETPIAVGFAHVTETPRSPKTLRPDLPDAMSAAMLRALEKDPARRFADAAEMKRILVGT